jgi:uncharacterized membrane protein
MSRSRLVIFASDYCKVAYRDPVFIATLCIFLMMNVTGDKGGSLSLIYVLSNFSIIGVMLIVQLKF